MNCLTNAIALEQARHKQKDSPHLAAYKKVTKQSEREKLTAIFDQQMGVAGYIFNDEQVYKGQDNHVIFREWKFWPTRKFSFDRAWPGEKLAVEIEGGIWRRGGGAHSHPTSIMRDIEKYNAAVLLGWRVLRFSDYHLKSPYFLECIETALKGG